MLSLFQHLEPGTEPFTPEQEFGEMTLSDYDSDEDADYVPSESEESDELEYDRDVSVSCDEEGDECDHKTHKTQAQVYKNFFRPSVQF